MVSVLDAGYSGPDSSPGPGHCIVFFWARRFTLIVPHFIQVSKCVLANYCWGSPCVGLASHPGESRNTPSHFILQKAGYSNLVTGM